MKGIILRLIITVSLPIIIGVGFVLGIFYNIIWQALDQWQSDSIQWINLLQQQILKNSAYSSQVLLEYSFNQLELHMVVIAGLIKKYQNQQIIYNPKTIFTVCSYREFTFNECPQFVYDQLNESIFYADLYFVRSQFKFNLLTPQQQYFLKTNDFISFYGRAAFQATNTQGLIQISNIYNSDNTSVQTSLPSVFYNYTDADYETCYGTNYTEPYDPRCRDWFIYAQNNKGIFIYEPYIDALTGSVLMSLSTQMEYESKFYSVDTIDFTMQNIVELLGSNQSENQYSVLIHEFNSTVFYHPLLIFQQVTTLENVEFFNINQFCSSNQIQMDLCLLNKQQFSDQIDKTVEFIKTGNYSIENQISLSQLYQYWERFGQKQVSIFLPIMSRLKGYNNQKPYSYAIILVGRELQGVVIIFIKIQQIEFEQKGSRTLSLKNTNVFSPLGDNRALNQSADQMVFSESNPFSELQKSNSQSFQQKLFEKSITFNLVNTSLKESCAIKQSTQSNSILEENIQQKKNKEKDKKKILQGLKPLFQEMKIIKKVFQDLEMLINYKIDAQNQSSQNNINTLFHFSKAKVTFQQLRNQTGLSRCYFNLGIIYLINNGYQLASEYFAAAIQTSSEIIGISYENLINQKIINLNPKNSENSLIILSKSIVSKAYCLKEQAFSLIYQDFNQIEDDQTKQKINQKHYIQKINCNQTDEIYALLKISLKNYQTAYNLALKNENNFSVIFKIFILQEIIEIMINLKQTQYIESDLKTLVQLLDNSESPQIQLNQSVTKRFSQRQKYDQQFNFALRSQIFEDTFDVKTQILQIQKSRQHFLYGLLEQKQNNLYNSAEQFFICLEEGSHYNNILRKKTVYHLNQLFRKIPQYQIISNTSDINQELNNGIDLVFLIELEYQTQNYQVEYCLKNIQQSYLIKKNDRMLILIFHSELDIFIPYTSIYSEAHWSQIQCSLQNIQRVIFSVQKSSKQNLHWKQALFESFYYVYQYDLQNLIYLDQFQQKLNKIDQNNLNNSKQDTNYFKSFFQNQNNQRKKVILLFSKDDKELNQKFNENNLVFQQKCMNFQKPHVYHIKEYSFFSNCQPEQNFQSIIYQTLSDEKQILQKLKQLRNSENLNPHQEFLSILNNV
ncbi:hypothetical protein ABPG73_008030 [Tetrahymena malaccensis]